MTRVVACGSSVRVRTQYRKWNALQVKWVWKTSYDEVLSQTQIPKGGPLVGAASSGAAVRTSSSARVQSVAFALGAGSVGICSIVSLPGSGSPGVVQAAEVVVM